ncbi:MAG: tryptophan-rich sensory protein [Anaerolineae bacterium]|nr:tryptophan-rich sensory protein [Anaerolineae bacterium]
MDKLPTLLLALLVPNAAGGIGALATASSVDTWYRGLRKPSWNPPGWVFGPAWTILYTMMGAASWLVSRSDSPHKDRALRLYGLQLSLNILWSVIFFGLRRVDLALVEIAALWGLILATLTSFYRVRPLAGLLLVPYQLWTSFAAVLNYELWRLNHRR